MVLTIVVEHSTTASQWQKRHRKGEVVVFTILFMMMMMMMMMMTSTVMVMMVANLIPEEGDVCEEVKKCVNCVVLRTGWRHIPDHQQLFLIKIIPHQI